MFHVALKKGSASSRHGAAYKRLSRAKARETADLISLFPRKGSTNQYAVRGRCRYAPASRQVFNLLNYPPAAP